MKVNKEENETAYDLTAELVPEAGGTALGGRLQCHWTLVRSKRI